MAEEKVASTYLNVADFQIRGAKNIPMSSGDKCEPMVNSENGKQFYRVVLNDNTVLKNGEEELDVSQHVFTIPAGNVRDSKFGGKGLWMPEDWTLHLTRDVKKDDGTYTRVSDVTIGGPEDKFSIENLKNALSESRKIWREAHPNQETKTKEQANPKADIAQGKDAASKEKTQAKDKEQTLSR